MSIPLRDRCRCATIVSALVVTLACAGIACSAAAQTQEPPATRSDPALRDYLSANGLLNRGLNELAIEEYRKFLATHPSHEKADVARYGLGVALFRIKRYEEAARELQPLVDNASFEFAAETLLIVGQSRFELKDWDGAVTPLLRLATERSQHDAADEAAVMAVESLYRLERAKEVDAPWSLFEKNWPESPMRERADYLRGLALVSQDLNSDAAAHFAAMRERFPKGEFAERSTLLRGQCLHRDGRLEEAAKEYRALSDRDDDLGADATFGYATVSRQTGDDATAASNYDRFIERWPEHASIGPALIERGRLCVNERDFKRARDLLQRAGEKDLQRADEATYWLAKCDLREDQPAVAAERLGRAIVEHPESRLRAEMMYDRGVALAKANDAAVAIEALETFRGAFADHTLVPDATALQATLEHQRGGYDASADLCAEFFEAPASDAHDQAAAIMFLAAENDLLRDRFEDAEQGYERFLAAHPEDPQAKTARYRLGSAQFRLQQFDNARPNLAQAVDGKQTDKPFRRGLLMLGDIAFQQEKWEQAIGLLGDYMSFGLEQPAADDAMLKRGIALARLERYDEADRQFSELLASSPDSPHRLQAIFERGQTLVSLKRPVDATPLFEEVVNAGESRFRAYAINHLASIAMQSEQWDRAAELYAQVESAESDAEGASDLADAAPFHRGQALMASGKYPDAAEVFTAMLKDDPQHVRTGEARAQLAIALSRSKDHEKALSAIEIAEQRHAANLPAGLAAAMMYEKAWCLRELDRDEDAMIAYWALLRDHPDDDNAPHAMLELAELEAVAGNHEQSSKLLADLHAASADQDRVVSAEVRERGLYRLAVSDFELGRFDDAARHAEAFIGEFADSDLGPSARLFAGEAHFRQSRWENAAEHFSVITQKHAEDPGCATALLRLGECQAKLQRWPDSERTFAAYLERFGEEELWFQAQFGLGLAREHRGLHNQAIEAYRKVIERHSGATAARAQFQIGECLFAQKKHADAVRELLKVDILYGYPEWSAAALYEAGRCFEEMDQREQARAQFEQVRQKYPETQWAKLAGERLAAAASPTPGG